jgi:hypothetical protein
LVFNLKVGVLYFLVTVLAIFTVYRAIDERAGNADIKDRTRLVNAVEGFKTLVELDAFKRVNLARRVVESELPAYVAQLDHFRERLKLVDGRMREAEPRNKYPQDEIGMGQARKTYLRSKESATIDAFVAGLAEKVGEISTGALSRDFEAEVRAQFEACMIVGWDACFFDLIYDTLVSNVLNSLGEQGIYDHKMIVIIADRRGAGWAHSRYPHWANQDDFAERYPIIGVSRERFLRHQRVREEVGRGRSQLVADMDLVSMQGDYFLVTVVPIAFAGQYRGSVMVGTELDDELVQQYRKALDLHVGFVLEDRLIQATLSNNEAFRGFVEREIRAIPRDDHLARVIMRDEVAKFHAMGFYFEGGGGAMGLLPTDTRVWSSRKMEKLQVVLAVEGGALTREFGSLKALVLLLGGVVFFVGFVLIFVAAHYYAKPFEQIDAGIHEILAGNHSHQFIFADRDDLANSMAQNLNLMVAVLSGNSLPEDSETSRWVETLMIEDAPQGTAESMKEDDGDGPAESESDTESAERYYRRVFDNYFAARDGLGKSNDGISYVKFVEKLVKTEKAFKVSHDIERVRFRVVVRDHQVVLVPDLPTV